MLNTLAPETAGGWQDHGACQGLDPDLFFPDDTDQDAIAAAKAICAACPVRAECLDHALAHRERHGIWGGLTERERRPLRRPIPPAACGTRSGYQRHLRHHERPCPACNHAHLAYQRRHRPAL